MLGRFLKGLVAGVWEVFGMFLSSFSQVLSSFVSSSSSSLRVISTITPHTDFGRVLEGF